MMPREFRSARQSIRPRATSGAISRRIIIVGTTLALATSALRAQPRDRKPIKVGWLKIQDQSHTPGQLTAFLNGMRDLGQQEGLTFIMDYRFANGDSKRLTALAEELVKSGSDLILATSQPVTDAARRVTKTIPIAGRMTDDPVRTGAAQSLRRPGGNVTGVYSLLEEMSAKRLALLKQAAPNVRRVGALLTLDRGQTAHWLAESRKAAEGLGLEIHPMNVHSASELDGLFAQAAAQGVNGLIGFRNPTLVTHDRRVIELANRYRMPSIFEARDFVDIGGFVSYGPNLETIFRGLAGYVDRIAKGAKPGDLPIEQPTEFEMVINLKTAKMLGVKVPDAMLVSANQVIE